MKKRLFAFARHVQQRVAASMWSTVLFRAALLALGLVVLAWIGRIATAAPPPPNIGAASRIDPAAERDAGSMTTTTTTTLTMAAMPIPNAAPIAASASSSASATPPTRASPAQQGPTRASVEDPVYVNHAGVEDLRRLPGVGPKRAEAIMALRQKMGRFQRVEDLLRVKGIGRATLRKWRPLVRLDAPPAPASPASVEAADGG